MAKTLNLLRVLLWMVCAFHLIVGVGLNLTPSMAPLMAQMYGAEVNWNPELNYIIKPLGAFMIALGIAAAGAAINPMRYRAVIYSFAALFLLRAAQRIIFANELQETFSIDGARNLGNVCFFVLLAVALIVLETLTRKKSIPTNAA